MKKNFLLLIILCCLTQVSFAQLTYGFKAGLNFNTLRGPSETDGSGKELESFSNSTGFHVGGGLIYKVTDLFGIKLDILFSQKGTFYKFDGPSYFIFSPENRAPITTTGNRNFELDISNSYIDLPLLAYIKIGSRLELSGGINVAFLVGSTASGELSYTGTTSAGTTVQPFSASLDYNYFKDDIGSEIGEEVQDVLIGSAALKIPTTLNAFYEYETKGDSYYNIIDVGLNGGISYFINRGLYFGLRANIGLADVTNNEYEVSLTALNNNSKISRADKDTNLSFQASLGFSF